MENRSRKQIVYVAAAGQLLRLLQKIAQFVGHAAKRENSSSRRSSFQEQVTDLAKERVNFTLKHIRTVKRRATDDLLAAKSLGGCLRNNGIHYVSASCDAVEPSFQRAQKVQNLAQTLADQVVKTTGFQYGYGMDLNIVRRAAWCGEKGLCRRQDTTNPIVGLPTHGDNLGSRSGQAFSAHLMRSQAADNRAERRQVSMQGHDLAGCRLVIARGNEAVRLWVIGRGHRWINSLATR
ncbi:hypothetical protein ACN2C6_01810 [Caulobacter sp. ErkDOM-YI]|uniref:hypothetical protein n=1 Tax=unclassified Caulobacter TaxID=2648921 RepID=UPI003AF7C134